MSQGVTFGWIKTDSISSEKHVPSHWIGRRNIKLGSKNNIDLIIIDGYEKYDKQYLDSLEDVGYSIVNASKQYHFLSKKFHILNRFGEYEKKCFLRWLILEDLYSGDPVIHYDGDIVFNETPERLDNIFGKYTFICRGWPGFASIRNPEWYEQYSCNLNSFTDNIESYSADAWEKRIGWEHTYEDNWAGSRYRKIITSDQDLISHLLHTKNLLQESPQEILNQSKDLILFDNPTYFFAQNMDIAPFRYSRQNGVDYINDKKIAFWHMQSDFCYYLKLVYFWDYLMNLDIKILNPLERKKFKLYEKIKCLIIEAGAKIFVRDGSRLKLCQYFFETNDFHLLFNKDIFWLLPEEKIDQFKLENI